MLKFENRLVKNRKSPENESDYIEAYKQMNNKADRPDGLDIAAVITTDGIKGHALVTEENNRSKDSGFHYGKDFIPDSELKTKIK